jgi:tRNA(Arg) A34 adenosine deaminase TadA
VATPPRIDPLRRAVEAAWAARRRNDHPFGAVVTDAHGDVLTVAGNTVMTSADPTGHAELNAVRTVGRARPDLLPGATLWTSTEPCAMCAGAIYWAGIGRVVYALAETELLEITGTDPRNPTMALPCRTVFAAGSRSVLVEGPVELPEAREVHAGFWNG